MLQGARPISDLANSGWSPTPLYAQLNGVSPNDSAPVVCPLPPGGSFKVQLGSLAPPITGTQTLTVRGLATTANVTLISFFLLQGNTVIAGRSVQPTQAFVNYDLVLTDSEIELITDYTNLSVLVVAFGTGGSGSGSVGSGKTTLTTACCNSVPTLLHMTWSGQTNSNYNFPASIPLIYDPVSQNWFSPCYFDATSSCYVQLTLSCDGSNGRWRLVNSSGAVTPNKSITQQCSPFMVTFGTQFLAGTLNSDCSAGLTICNSGSFFGNITVTA